MYTDQGNIAMGNVYISVVVSLKWLCMPVTLYMQFGITGHTIQKTTIKILLI